MRKTILLVAVSLAVWALPAFAGEKLLGRIVSAAGADTTNASTAAPFYVPPAHPITIWCNADAYVITDSSTAADATGNALPVVAKEKFPTSTGSLGTSPSVVVSSQKSAIVRIFGTAAVTCYVYSRKGDE